MNTARFKTNIKCSGCVAKVTPFLNSTVGEDNWEVDVQNSDKILTIQMDTDLSQIEIVQAVEQAGFKAESIG